MRSLFVGNLAFNATEDDVRSTFERYGRVARVEVVTDKLTGRSKGFGFVRMGNLDDTDEALTRLNGFPLKGRNLIVHEAREKSPARPQPANRLWDLLSKDS